MAIEYRLEVDIELSRIKKATKTIRNESRSNEAKAVASMIEGVFNIYNSFETPSLIALPDKRRELADIFLELIEDKYYISLCETSHAFGYEKNITYVKQKLNKIVKEILKNPAFKNIFNLGTKGIEINTQIPMPDSEMATTILAGNYLPPNYTNKSYSERLYTKLLG